MRPSRRLFVFGFLIPATTLSLAACVWIFNQVQVEPLGKTADSVSVVSPVKAHLLDGSTVVYATGVQILRDTLFGAGTRYDLALANPAPVNRLPLDSVVGMETFRTQVLGAETFLVSVLATGGAVVGTAALLVAIFGSCPTFYADSAGAPVLEAESFSYSIAPLLEVRDVDRLRTRADADGLVRLEVRNEALETHYINHLELLEIRHTADEVAVPDPQGRPLALRRLRAPAAAVDRRGRDVRATLAAAEGDVFRTDRGLLEDVSASDMEDWIDLAFPAPRGADSIALVLRLRNSLLNTVLFYEQMLGSRGARALDWMGSDLQQIGPAVELGRWYTRKMGMRVAVRDVAGYRGVARIPDVGPIAWKDVAVVISVPPGDSLRVRLSFVADNWRIDRVATASQVRRPAAHPHALRRVVGPQDGEDPMALASLSGRDERYLQTSPGERFRVVFDAGRAPEDSARTFFLVSQGYYTEWIRQSWVASARDTSRFTPSDEGLLAALARWRSVQDDFERRFEATRIPVR